MLDVIAWGVSLYLAGAALAAVGGALIAVLIDVNRP